MTNDRALQGLQVAISANAAAYRHAVQTSAPGEIWDFLILTAANEKQAQGYRQELALRQRAVGHTGAFFPAAQRTLVVADPPGPRIGSGGATLNVLRVLAKEHGISREDVGRLRILLIHSGGMSQRLPAYSPLGKIFAPLPLLRPDGQIATLFDHLYVTLAGLPDRLGPGLLVLAGDVFLLFDHRHVQTPGPGVTALSMRVEPEMGEGHGVFVTDSTGPAGGGTITRTLQKASVDEQRKAGAIDESGRVLIDTGILFFDPESTQTLMGLSGDPRRRSALHEKHRKPLDLYEDITGALATQNESAFTADASTRSMRRSLFRVMRGNAFNAVVLEGQFLHLGTTLQFREAMTGRSKSPAAELFQQDVLAHTNWPVAAGARVYHSVLLAGESRGSLGAQSVVEHSILGSRCRIGPGCVVSQVVAVKEPVELSENLLLFQVPVKDAAGQRLYVHVVCGVMDDFKGKYADGKCVYLNENIDVFLKRRKLTPEQVWPGVEASRRTLWTAAIFPATELRDHASAATELLSARAGGKYERYSMQMLLEQADPEGLIAHREAVGSHLQALDLLDAISRGDDKPAESFLGRWTTQAAYEEAERLISEWAARPTNDAAEAVDQARALWCRAQLLQRPDHPATSHVRSRIDRAMAESFAKVAVASEIGHRAIAVQNSASLKLVPEVEIEASSPVRLDLAGGWSDTPPYCFEEGGHVVNVAIDLDGRPPVRATVRTTKDPRVVLESRDLGKTTVLDEVSATHGVDVHDPFSLHKVALGIVGLLPEYGGFVSPHMKRLGAGLHITTEARVPKGSGLGTSSILAATLLAALHKALGREASHEQLIEQTLLLEQRLSTGGGWQDQIGGILGGFKSTITAGGIPQRPVVERLALSDRQYDELTERLVVYYSGQQRLARDILRRVMGRWLAREPAVVLRLKGLRTGAANLREALLKSRWADVAGAINEYWQIKKDLYAGSTTPTIDVLLLELRDLYTAAGLAGAGGGGFAYFLCKDARQAAKLRMTLAERSDRPGTLGGVYETQINRKGLTVVRK